MRGTSLTYKYNFGYLSLTHSSSTITS